MKPALIDISVLILFFNRPETLKETFESVRAARPSRLFLYQDGPRGERDMEGVLACRAIVENIDWECTVERNYQTVNAGCDPSEFNAQRWAFSRTEKCVVFEDDAAFVPSLLPFFKEMLDRYEHDERIGMITAFNPDERTTDVEGDYFFSTNFSIWGWASWRRVVSAWDEQYSFLDNPVQMAQLQALVSERRLRKDFLPMAAAHRAQGKAFYETIFHAHLLLNSQLAIVPRVNMLNNIGALPSSTHFAGGTATLPHAYRRLFTMGRHDLSFPLTHPTAVLDHVAFRLRVYRTYGWNHPWIKVARSLEELWLNLRHGNFSRITSAVRNRLSILFGGRKFH